MPLLHQLTLIFVLAASPAPADPAAGVKDLGHIMFLGNSFIEGHSSPNLSWQGGSRKVIEDILTAKKIRFEFVGRNQSNSRGMANPKHNGFGGIGITDLLEGITREGVPMGSLTHWLKESPADIYVIDIGRSENEGSSVSELKIQFMKLLRKIFSTSPKARIIWSEQTAPKPIWFPQAQAHLHRANLALNELSVEQSELGRCLLIAKVAKNWNPDLHLDTDGVHASDGGYQYLGQAQAKLLLSMPAIALEPGAKGLRRATFATTRKTQ